MPYPSIIAHFCTKVNVLNTKFTQKGSQCAF